MQKPFCSHKLPKLATEYKGYHAGASAPPLCSKSDLLGRPGEGIHRARIAGLAAADLALTGIAAGVLSKWLHVNAIAVFVVLIILAVCVHEMMCADTRLNAWLFGRPWRDSTPKSPVLE